MPRNRRNDRRDDRIERGVDNPRIRETPRAQERPQAGVVTPRTYRGSDFRDFPRLVVQLGRPRPRARVGGAARSDGEAPPPAEPAGQPAPNNEPREGFARPLRGMGVNRYEGLRSSLQPQIESYRTAVHDAHADGTVSEEERRDIRGQRRDLRQDVRQYRNQNPLQMGLGSRVRGMAQGDSEGGIGNTVRQIGSPGVNSQQRGRTGNAPSPQDLQQLLDAWKSGQMTPEEILAALGFTGELPEARNG